MRALLLCLAAAWLACGEPLVRQAELDPTRAVPLLLAGSAEVARAPDVAAIDELDRLARRVFLHGWRVPGRDRVGLVVRTVEPGQTLTRIGRSAGISAELLLRLNPGVDPRRLAVGSRLAVLDAAAEPLRIDVRLGLRRLMVWRGAALVMGCAVGIGAEASPTPTGSTRIAVRVKNPEWRDPATGRVHPPGSPGNLLGGYWLGFDPGPDRRFASIGCHGWTGDDPTRWLGQGGSRGCIRLIQTDLHDLFDLVAPGTPVTVRP